MKSTITLAVVLAALLAGALIASRVLLDAPVALPPPPPPAPLAAAPSPTAPRPPERTFPVAAPRAELAPTPTAAAPVPQPDAIIEAEPGRAPPPSPNAVIDEAVALVTLETTTAEQARAAAEIFVECLRVTPGDSRCARGLRLAHRRQLPRALPPREALPATTFRAEPTPPSTDED